MKTLIDKLKKMAVLLDAEKPKLHFVGLVHRVQAPDRWDLIVSSDQFIPRSMSALRYVGEHLKKALKVQELIRISRIVVLPRNHEVIAELKRNSQLRPGELGPLLPADRFDQAVVIWPRERPENEPKKVRSKSTSKLLH